jgi:DNA-directed RNA polymerase specialized sigma24 family protein
VKTPFACSSGGNLLGPGPSWRSKLEDHVLRTDLTDHRGTDDAGLVRAVADGDAIALAEAYHRTITAAHACARRLLASPVEIEALLRSVYSELWEEPPVDEALEGWVRARCFTLGTGYLRQRGLSAPSASLAAWSSGIDADEHNAGHDPLERMIAELTTEQQAALVRAHDQGLRTAEQEDPEAGVALQHALLVLASPLTDDERHAAEMCSSGVALANWIFGLLPPHEAATVPGTAAEPTPCGRLAGVLRRARRRFEPLPPTPDLGHRVLAWVLSTSTVRGAGDLHASSLDTDLRVASADLDRGAGDRANGAPRSSLDMSVPASLPAETEQQPVTALRRDGGGSPEGWARPDVDDDQHADTGEHLPTPLRSPGGPPALAGSNAPPLAFGNAAPALAPDFVEDDGEELVRMPLRQTGRPALAPRADRGTSAPGAADDDTQTIRATPGGPPDEDTVPPPAALRPAQDDDTHPPSGRRPEPARNPLGMPARTPPGIDDDSAAPSPLTAEERRGSLTEHNMSGDSPLRRPAPGTGPAPAPGRELDTEPHSLLGRSEPTDDRSLPTHGRQEAGTARPGDHDATDQTPVQRDDSDPRFDDLFGDAARDADGRPSALSGSQAANLTAPTLPAARRPTPPSSPSAPRGTTPSSEGRPAPSASTQTAPTAPVGPTVSSTENEPGGGGSVLRWLVVVLLIAAGAAVGIFLGQMLI